MRTDFGVYVLCDPRRTGTYKYKRWKFPFEPFYVGKGLAQRPYDHVSAALRIKSGLKNKRIRSIIRSGHDIVVYWKASKLSECEAFALEARLIRTIGRACTNEGTLLNKTSGGQGLSGHLFSEAHREKIADANRRRLLSKETKRKIGEKSTGRVFSEEDKERCREGHKNMTESSKLDRREKMRVAHLGKKFTKSHREKIRDANKGKVMSDETRAKLSASCTGRVMSEETREKIRNSLLGKTRGPYKKQNKS